MSLALPANFKNDIQSRDTALIPVVAINHTDLDTTIWLSTNSFTFEDPYLRVVRPLLLNIPSLKESIDVDKRKYKISSVNLTFSNYAYNGSRMSDARKPKEDDKRKTSVKLNLTGATLFGIYPKDQIL